MDWTINRSFFDVIMFIMQYAWVIMIAGPIANIIVSILYFFTEKKKVLLILLQIISVSFIIPVFLAITSFLSDFLKQLSVGYFLCGLGLIICSLEIVMLIINRINFTNTVITTSAQAEENDEILPEHLSIEKEFYEALNHEIRRKILRLIDAHGSSTFTEFKQVLDIGTGTLYHHLKMLSSLVYQKEDKHYYLTKLGNLTVRFIQDNLSYLTTITKEDKEGHQTRFSKQFISRLKLERVFTWLFESKPVRARFAIIIPLIMICVPAILGFQNNFFFFINYELAEDAIAFTPILQVPAYLVGGFIGWFFAWGLIELFSFFNFKKRGNYYISLIGTGLSFLPILIYALIVYLIHTWGADLSPLLSGTLLITAQLGSVYMLVAFNIYHKDLKVEKAISIVLPVHYISIFLNVLLFAFG